MVGGKRLNVNRLFFYLAGQFAGAFLAAVHKQTLPNTSVAGREEGENDIGGACC